MLDALYWRRLDLNDALRQQLSELPGTKTLADLSDRATSLGSIRVRRCLIGPYFEWEVVLVPKNA